MTQRELAICNLGQSLDDLANLDPRGYGVCKILYRASREYTGGPLCMNAAVKLTETVKKDDFVYILTGFVLRPYNKAEMDGIVSSVLLCRALVKAFGAKPVIVCPEDNRPAVENMSACVGLHLFEDMEVLQEMPVSMGMICFTKDEEKAGQQAEEILAKTMPSAVISIECPGANALGCYHNATGLDVTALEAKQDILFEKLKERGVLNIAIGDLGNEIGMGTIRETLVKYIPYAASGACRCDCKGGIAARTSADHIITATVSDWGCYAMVAALAFLLEDIDIMHTKELEEDTIQCARSSGMIDMNGWMIPAIDGFGLEINLPVVALMRELVVSGLKHRSASRQWFEKVQELGYFDTSESAGKVSK